MICLFSHYARLWMKWNPVQMRLEEGILTVVKVDAAIYISLASRRLLFLRISSVLETLILQPCGGCMLDEPGCSALPSCPLPLPDGNVLGETRAESQVKSQVPHQDRRVLRSF